MSQKNPDASDFLTIAAVLGVGWLVWRRSNAATSSAIAPDQTAAQIAAQAVAVAAAAPYTPGQVVPPQHENQFTDYSAGGLHCKNGQTLQTRDSILGCYDVGANGPLGASWSKEFRAANPLMVLPDSYPVF